MGTLDVLADRAERAAESAVAELEPRTRALVNGLRDRRTRDRQSRTRGGWGASRSSRKNTERIDPDRDRHTRNQKLYDTTPIVSAPIDQFNDDVLADGWRIEADDDRTQDFLTEWSEQNSIVAGEPGKNMIELLEIFNRVLEIHGESPVENVHARERPDATVAFKMIPPATLSYHTRPQSSMLIQPGDIDRYDAKVSSTEGRDTAAAYTQYAEYAGSWSDAQGQQLQPVHLDFEQVTRAVRNPEPGSVTGTGSIDGVAPEVEELKEFYRMDHQAIESNAWGQWFAGLEPLVVDEGDQQTIYEVDDQAVSAFEEQLEWMEAGDILTHDGQINVQNLPGHVADIIDRYEYHTDLVLSALPAPKFMVGFADNINRDVADDQRESHDQRVQTRRNKISRTFTPVYREVAETFGYNPSGVKFLLEPEPDSSPILSFSKDEIEKFEIYARGLSHVYSDPELSIDEETLLADVSQLPDDAGRDIDTGTTGLDDTTDEAQQQFNEMMNGDGSGSGGQEQLREQEQEPEN